MALCNVNCYKMFFCYLCNVNCYTQLVNASDDIMPHLVHPEPADDDVVDGRDTSSPGVVVTGVVQH